MIKMAFCDDEEEQRAAVGDLLRAYAAARPGLAVKLSVFSSGRDLPGQRNGAGTLPGGDGALAGGPEIFPLRGELRGEPVLCHRCGEGVPPHGRRGAGSPGQGAGRPGKAAVERFLAGCFGR